MSAKSVLFSAVVGAWCGSVGVVLAAYMAQAGVSGSEGSNLLVSSAVGGVSGAVIGVCFFAAFRLAYGASATTKSESQVTQEGNITAYRAVSKAAVLSLVLGILAVFGIIFLPLTTLSLAGLVFGLVAIGNLRRYPEELIGRTPAALGVVLSLFIFIGSLTVHTIVYMIEVPEGYNRVAFFQLEKEDVARELDGKLIFVKGYVHPSVQGMGTIRKFVLVPDMKTCCFGGQPKKSDMMEVTLTKEHGVRYDRYLRRVGGTFRINTNKRKTAGGLEAGNFTLEADYLK